MVVIVLHQFDVRDGGCIYELSARPYKTNKKEYAIKSKLEVARYPDLKTMRQIAVRKRMIKSMLRLQK